MIILFIKKLLLQFDYLEGCELWLKTRVCTLYQKLHRNFVNFLGLQTKSRTGGTRGCYFLKWGDIIAFRTPNSFGWKCHTPNILQFPPGLKSPIRLKFNWSEVYSLQISAVHMYLDAIFEWIWKYALIHSLNIKCKKIV